MYSFATEQRIAEVGHVKVGGQPGELPTVLFGTVYYGKRFKGIKKGELIELDSGSSDRLARDITGYGADAIVVEPQSLRDDVLARLRAHAGRQ